MDDGALRDLAHTLREIDAGLLKHTSRGERRRWFQGREPYFDVFFELDRRGVSWFQLTLRGRAVTWSRRDGHVQTGRTNERDVAVESHPASKLLASDAALDEETLHQALVICDELQGDKEFSFAWRVLKAAHQQAV